MKIHDIQILPALSIYATDIFSDPNAQSSWISRKHINATLHNKIISITDDMFFIMADRGVKIIKCQGDNCVHIGNIMYTLPIPTIPGDIQMRGIYIISKQHRQGIGTLAYDKLLDLCGGNIQSDDIWYQGGLQLWTTFAKNPKYRVDLYNSKSSEHIGIMDASNPESIELAKTGKNVIAVLSRNAV